MRFLVLVFLTLAFLAQSVEAHVLKADGSVGAVIHIDPEDDPIIGTPSNIYFEFKDKNNKFSLDSCTCTFIVLQNGREIHRETLTSDTAVFTFPEKNVYTVKVEGTSQDRSFEPFTLTYDFRITREAGNSQTEKSWIVRHLPHVIGVGMLTVLVVFAIVRQERRKKQ